MLPHSEFRWCQFPDALRAACDIEDASAFFAAKMVMMPFVRSLVPCGLAGNLDSMNPTPIKHRCNCTIDGRDAKPIDSARAILE